MMVVPINEIMTTTTTTTMNEYKFKYKNWLEIKSVLDTYSISLLNNMSIIELNMNSPTEFGSIHCVKCIPDYVDIIYKTITINGNKLNPNIMIQFRTNAINWVAHAYMMLENKKYQIYVSLSTLSVFIDIYDRFISCLISKKTEESYNFLADIFTSNRTHTTMDVVIARLALNYNEDKPPRLTHEYVNTYIKDGNEIDVNYFIGMEMYILDTLKYDLYSKYNPKYVLEAFIPLLKEIVRLDFGTQHGGLEIFYTYCRYLMDWLMLSYKLMTMFSVSEVVACCIYISKLCWPSNYVNILLYSTETYKPTLEYKIYTREELIWLANIKNAFNLNLRSLFCMSQSMVFLANNSCIEGMNIRNSKTLTRYESQIGNGVHKIGVPDYEVFKSNQRRIMQFFMKTKNSTSSSSSSSF
jgi:hypothetical protein